jgi:hypothetical protein
MLKKLVLGLSAFLCLAPKFTFANDYSEAFAPALVDVSPDTVYTPLGFDDNDNVQIVLDGALPNTCYKIGPASARIDVKEHKVYVHQQAFYYPGAWCAEVRVPYVQTLNLGVLKSGAYEVYVESEGAAPRAAAVLPVAVATSNNPDDYLYAPVTDAHIERGDEFSTLVLNGVFGNSCMKFLEVKTNVRANGVIEVLPIIQMQTGVTCAEVTLDFNLNVTLKGVPHGRYLIHIRSLNGQSVNRVANL